MPQPSEMESPLSPFIEAAKAKGASDESLARLLEQRGWPEREVYRALGAFYERVTGQPIPVRGAGAGERAKDAFLYLLSFSTLGVWAFALGALIFAYLTKWFPDPVAARGALDFTRVVSNSLASLIVAFPIYLVVMRLIVREVQTHSEKRDSGIRKWLTYLALLIAAGVVIGDLITFLDFFFRGELTIRFVLKVATVLAIAGGIFWYYLSGLRTDTRSASDAGEA